MNGKEIPNWCGTHPIEIAIASTDTIRRHGPLIYILQNAGGMNFQHTLTTNQARQMAHTMLGMADEAEIIGAKVAA